MKVWILVSTVILGACAPCDPVGDAWEGSFIDSPGPGAGRNDTGYLVTWTLRGEEPGPWGVSADTAGNWSEPHALVRPVGKLVGSGDRYLAVTEVVLPEEDFAIERDVVLLDRDGDEIADVPGTERFIGATAIPDGWFVVYTDAPASANATMGDLFVAKVMFDGQRMPLERVASNVELTGASVIELAGLLWVIYADGTDAVTVRYATDGTRMDIDPLLIFEKVSLIGAYSAGDKAMLGIKATVESWWSLMDPDGTIHLPQTNTWVGSVSAGIPGMGFMGRDASNRQSWVDLTSTTIAALAFPNYVESTGAVVGAPGGALVVRTGFDTSDGDPVTDTWLEAAIVPFGGSMWSPNFRQDYHSVWHGCSF